MIYGNLWLKQNLQHGNMVLLPFSGSQKIVIKSPDDQCECRTCIEYKLEM